MAVEVGMGYVSVVPEVQGFAGELERQVTGPAASAGAEGGQAAGEGFTGKMGGVLKGGLAAVGIAAMAVLVKGFGDALAQSGIDGKIQATLGSTPAEAARYGKAAGQLYAHGVTGSVEEAAAAISGVMRSGILPPDATNAQIESITGRVSDLSDTFELDLAQTSNAVGQILKNGLAKDGTEALDILTAGMQRMGPRADDMADTFNEYSTKFRDLGLSAKDAMGLMSQGLQAGARDTDTVADALKEFQIRATDGSKASAEAYTAIGLNAESMTKKIAGGGAGARQGLQQVLDGIKAIKDPAERNAAAVGLFGTKAEDLGQALFALNPATAVKALGDTAGAAGRMGDALHNNAGAKVEQFKRSLEVGLTNFMGGTVIPALTSFGGFLSSTFGPALSAGKNLVTGFFGVFTGGSGGASISGLGQSLMGLVTTVRDALAPSLSGLVQIFTTTVLPALQGVWNVVSTQLAPALMSLWSAISSSLSPILSGLASIFTEYVLPAAMKVYAAFVENVQPIISAFAEFIGTRVVPAVQLIGGKLAELVQKAQPVISVVTSIISWVGQLAAKILGAVIPVIVDLAGPIFSGLISALGTVIGWIGDAIGWVVKIGSSFGDALKWVKDFGKQALVKLAEFILWLQGLPKKLLSALGDFGSLLVDKGKDLVRGLWEGVKALGKWLAGKLLGWAKDIIPGPIAKALGINSPSRLMRDEIGRWIPPGIIEGIDAEQHALDARLKAMVTIPKVPAVSTPKPLLSRANDARQEAFENYLREIRAAAVPDVVVKIGSEEIARAVVQGNRVLGRR
ncbi:hypothetical protein GCM10010329_85100 [Streptomyces spiroverticillatus]|uniref:Phage tail tape measure protein domain-containing protein n=1 Tax=Streptomyces finlayi TaxID=67296 RepID=A0A918XAC4_9ACTN|nr:phage tail tape measure protein [Streptomyces finlayi]GHA49903.1 hypothetical protein GCM10010329_85100 [Streptomyces spiroverticillatus]GHD19552.1 hypothetical protein GCM10010334_83330 [Streptomyces finlayi]